MPETYYQGRRKITETPAYKAGEWFTKEDISLQTSFPWDFVASILNAMVRDGQLCRRQRGSSIQFKTLGLTPKKLLGRPWRKKSNAKLRVNTFRLSRGS